MTSSSRFRWVLAVSVLCFSVLFVTPASCSNSYHQQMSTSRHVALFVFGDSLFDPGNNQYINHTNKIGTGGGSPELSLPYGETYFRKSTGRISDGRIVPDFIAEFFNLPLWKAYLQPGQHNFSNGANFASGGAGVLSDTHVGTVINLRTQLSYFKDVVKTLKQQIGENQTQNLLKRAVYLFSIGGNDYFSFYSSHPNASLTAKTQHVRIVTSNLTQVLEEIYNIGGRKIAFQNAGALGCVASNVAQSADGKSCIEDLCTLANMHNHVLSQSLKNMERRLPGFKYSIFDYYHAIRDRVLHPTKYGFQNGTGSCYTGGMSPPGQKKGSSSAKPQLCKDPTKYVWWDGGHTTEACNWQLSKLMWKGKTDITSPLNFKQLYQLY